MLFLNGETCINRERERGRERTWPSIKLEGMVFSLKMVLLFILLYITVNELCKKIYFFIWFLNFFSGDLVLIKYQLILISYEMMELKKKKGPKYKQIKKHQTWMTCRKYRKRNTLVLKFKNNTNYIILVPQYFSKSFWYKSSFLLFFSS